MQKEQRRKSGRLGGVRASAIVWPVCGLWLGAGMLVSCGGESVTMWEAQLIDNREAGFAVLSGDWGEGDPSDGNGPRPDFLPLLECGNGLPLWECGISMPLSKRGLVPALPRST